MKRSHSIKMALACLLAAPAAAMAGTAIKSGHSGYWYDPARDGEGWSLEVLDAERGLLYWFTYDEDGNQRWLTAVGDVTPDEDGEALVFPHLVLTTGGRFGPEFDPEAVTRESVGNGVLRFHDCDSGEFSYTAFGQEMTIEVQRLTNTIGTRCETPHGVTGRPSAAHAGQSGSWYDPSHDGEGYTLQWIDTERALITWYSFDPDGNPYWMHGVGQFDEEGRIHAPLMHAARGARFGADFDPDDVERFEWGTLTLDLGAQCEGGPAQYASVLDSFGSGHLDVVQMTGLHEVACPWQAPKLTDLYEITYTPIVQPPSNPASRSFVSTITDDGTLYALRSLGTGSYELLRQPPGDEDWHVLPGGNVQLPVLVPPSGEFVLAYPAPQPAPVENFPMIWREDEGWQMLDGFILPNPEITGSSRQMHTLVGTERTLFPPRPGMEPQVWVWNEETGQVVLPPYLEEAGYRNLDTVSASEDGRIVVGAASMTGGLHVRALRWVDGDSPEPLFDRHGTGLGHVHGCAADCSLIFGAGQTEAQTPPHPNDRQPWYWRGPHDSAYLGALAEVPDDLSGPLYGVGDSTGDGNMVAGAYVAGISDSGTSTRLYETFLWTEHTGMVSLGTLLDELEIDAGEPWSERWASRFVDDGKTLLLTGRYLDGIAGFHNRAAILRLTEKTPPAR